jgi:hypothetical protein
MRHLLIISFFLVSITVHAQVKNEPGKTLSIKKATHKIHIDGVLDETDWKAAEVATDFFLNYPVDTARAPFQSEAKILFNH